MTEAGGYAFVRGGEEALDRVVGLWSELRGHVCARSKHFGEEMRALTWEERRREVLGKGQGTQVLVDLALAADGREVGYCVSTVDPTGRGEIDSIYVQEASRGSGLGRELVLRAIVWMEERGAKSMELSVTYGNEGVLPFYAELGFLPRSLVLMRKQRNSRGSG